MVFALRRASYVVVAILQMPSIIFNLMLLIVSSVLYFAWIEHFQPFQNPRNMRIESANELLLLLLTYHLLCLTDLTFVDSQVSTIQSSFLTIIIILICINFFAVITDAINWQKQIKRLD